MQIATIVALATSLCLVLGILAREVRARRALESLFRSVIANWRLNEETELEEFHRR